MVCDISLLLFPADIAFLKGIFLPPSSGVNNSPLTS